MVIQDWILEVLRCPITGQPLRAADSALVARLQEQQRSAGLTSHKGIPLEEPFQDGLINQGSNYFYRIADGIPTLLPDEAVSINEA